MLQTKTFAGNEDIEEPYAHIDFFEEIGWTFKLNAFTEDEVKLKLFGQTLTDKAFTWFKDCPAGAYNTWEELSTILLTRFYPDKKSYGARRMIYNFRNRPGESLIKGYIRFRGLLDYCPHHDLPHWLLVHTFYRELSDENREEVDMASGGAFSDFTMTQAWELLDTMHSNTESWITDVEGNGGVELDYECIQTFLKTGKQENLVANFHLDSDVILQIVKKYTEYLQVPKENWENYE
jgi:hypothetical protein